MKRMTRSSKRIQVTAPKIKLTEAEILADLRYGIDGQGRPGSAERRARTAE